MLYFEHSEEVVKSALSVGITTFFVRKKLRKPILSKDYSE